jgi:hypothetical protein
VSKINTLRYGTASDAFDVLCNSARIGVDELHYALINAMDRIDRLEQTAQIERIVPIPQALVATQADTSAGQLFAIALDGGRQWHGFLTREAAEEAAQAWVDRNFARPPVVEFSRVAASEPRGMKSPLDPTTVGACVAICEDRIAIHNNDREWCRMDAATHCRDAILSLLVPDNSTDNKNLTPTES